MIYPVEIMSVGRMYSLELSCTVCLMSSGRFESTANRSIRVQSKPVAADSVSQISCPSPEWTFAAGSQQVRGDANMDACYFGTQRGLRLVVLFA